MKQESLKNKILEFINTYDGWVSKGQIYDLCETEGYSPENGARRARELAEEGKIQTDTYKSKRGTNLVKYGKILIPAPPTPTKSLSFIMKNGILTAVLK